MSTSEPAWLRAEAAYEDEVTGENTLPRLFEASASRHASRDAQWYKGGVYDRSLAPGVVPTAPAGVVAPADGRISEVRDEGDRLRVVVFMNVTDVHVNRAPVPGSVAEVTHSPGRHLPAFSKESDRNERVVVDCGDTEVTLVAGAVARRIHPYVEAGDDLDRGQRLGHISFGSRADVLLPPEFDRDDVRVTEGQHVRAGETVVAA